MTTADEPYRWDWIVNEDLPHRGTYAVMRGVEVICTTNSEKSGYERAKRIAAALAQPTRS